MKIELSKNKVFFENNGSKKEIHPFWLRERVNGESFVDKGTQQRLFDPTELNENIEIKDLNLSDEFLEVSFNDGVKTRLTIQSIIKEFSNINDIKFIKKIKWDSSLNDFNSYNFSENIFEEKIMYEALINFYKFGFVIFKKVPTKNNFIVDKNVLIPRPETEIIVDEVLKLTNFKVVNFGQLERLNNLKITLKLIKLILKHLK